MGALTEMSRSDLINQVSKMRGTISDMRGSLKNAGAPSMTQVALGGAASFGAGALDQATGFRTSLVLAVGSIVGGIALGQPLAIETGVDVVNCHLYEAGKIAYDAYFVTPSSPAAPPPASPTI